MGKPITCEAVHWYQYTNSRIGTNIIKSNWHQNSEEAFTLIESGFDYILTALDGLMIFRKRK